VAVNERGGMPSKHPLEEFLRIASPPARLMATAFLNKRTSATSDAAREIIDEFLLEELRRLAALPAAPADGTPVNQFLAEWRTFAHGAEWQAFMRQHSHRDVALAWNQWRAFGAEHDRALPLLAEDTASDRAAAMEDAGVVRLDAVLSQATAVELRRYILAERDRVDVDATTGTQGDSLSRVLSPSNSGSGRGSKGEATTTRWDVRLPWDAPVERAVHEMLAGPLGEALHALSGGGEAPLFECAAIISAEGAAPQVLHSDTVLTDGRQLFTAFVAMQDIAPHMGPTRFLPATHQGADCASSHKKVARGEITLCEKAVSVSALDMHTGDCTLYDSRLLHCGGAHRAAPPATRSSERVLFYVSFQHAAASKRPDMRLIDDADTSILPTVAALDMRLGTLRSAL
jgi:ectoine hydroxylase-related dioxygenase (phytanoyl-CoA dioxygenase family)